MITGVILATIGMTALNSIGELMTGATELVKAKISIKLIEYNNEIERLQNEQHPSETRAIGFATTFKEDEEDDE